MGSKVKKNVVNQYLECAQIAGFGRHDFAPRSATAGKQGSQAKGLLRLRCISRFYATSLPCLSAVVGLVSESVESAAALK